jgi:hypothetical protein
MTGASQVAMDQGGSALMPDEAHIPGYGSHDAGLARVSSRRKQKALRTIIGPCYPGSIEKASDIRHANNGIFTLHVYL